jgi:hypothetical protein
LPFVGGIRDELALFGITPYGPLGKIQANPERSTGTAEACEKIMDRILKHEALRSSLVTSLVKGVRCTQKRHANVTGFIISPS